MVYNLKRMINVLGGRVLKAELAQTGGGGRPSITGFRYLVGNIRLNQYTDEKVS
jgi:hypothetical protein